MPSAVDALLGDVEHPLVEVPADEQEREVLRGQPRVPGAQQAALGESPHLLGERGEDASRCALVVGRREHGQPEGLADHQPAQREDLRVRHRSQVPARQGAQRGLEFAGRGASRACR